MGAHVFECSVGLAMSSSHLELSFFMGHGEPWCFVGAPMFLTDLCVEKGRERAQASLDENGLVALYVAPSLLLCPIIYDNLMLTTKT